MTQTELELHFLQFRTRAMARRQHPEVKNGSPTSNRRYSTNPLSLSLPPEGTSPSFSKVRLRKSRSVFVDGSESDGYGARDSNDPPWPLQCTYVVEELIQTEQDYVNDLGDIVQVGSVNIARRAIIAVMHSKKKNLFVLYTLCLLC